MIGESTIKWDALPKADGSFLYPSDLLRPEMVHVRVLRAQRPHALILSIDTSLAEQSAGVVCVLTHADISGLNRFGLIAPDQPVFCDSRVRFVGDVVAAVAAETEEQARAALVRIKIIYQDMPALLDPKYALEPGAPQLHDGGNLCHHVDFGFGDIDEAMTQSAVVARVSYATGRQEHAYLEPEAGISFVDEKGRICVICGGQNPFADRVQLARILNLPEDKIWVSHPPMGGAFGGKEDLNVQAYIALVTQKTGRPAKMVYDRTESIAYSVKRHRFDVEVEVGANASGDLTGFRAKLLADTGAYLTLGPGVMVLAAEHASGPYRFMATQITGDVVYTNTGNASAFRGFGNPQAILGIEQAMDDLAAKLDMDPITFRCRNLLKQGDRAGAGHILHSDATLGRLAEQASRSHLLRAPERRAAVSSATGIAFVWQGFGLGSGAERGSSVRLCRENDGRFSLELSQPDLGEGNLAAFMQIAASTLECKLEHIVLHNGSTDHTNSWSTVGSRSIAVTGSAVLKAAEAVRTRVNAGEVGRIEETAFFSPTMDAPLQKGAPHAGYAYGIQLVRVALDEVTGNLSVTEAETYLDPGTVISPKGVEGQIEGGFAQGLGYALSEELALSGGEVQNNRFSNYILPTIRDVPPDIRTILVSTPEPSNPLGARGIAEIGITPVAAAIANGLARLTSQRYAKFPITPEQIIGSGGIE
ncbi:xanthine dehydrogenase family protein molybdopterin-binding subunit [Roseovarius sp. B08]|uniref:xanthine dehydrogenase family protein molybdopterin-binding subunit n=1 Tax=Roseovarius sp. B08 TaxID=3449223 RepID=UPI003EDC61CF